MSYLTISQQQLDCMIRQGTPMMLIDLRDAVCYQQKHIMGAVNIPYENLMEHLHELPKDRPLVFYCCRGGQSMLACRDVGRLGYQVINVANGFSYYCGCFAVC